MKYGESLFDIAYLLFAAVSGIVILRRARNRTERWMGAAVLVLGFGDAFHLVPRVLRYFSGAELTAALGIGKLITSVTMTVFYMMLCRIWQGLYAEGEDRRRSAAVWILAAVRIGLCLFPQNGWLQNDAGMTWGILRNLPFTALGALVLLQFYRRRGENPRFRAFWLLILLSFLFYLPVAVGAGLVPVLGMLMLPKTVCYILMIRAFLLAVFRDGPETTQRARSPERRG